MLLYVVDGREIEWIPLEESVRGAVRAARGLDRRLRGRLRGGQSYGTRAQDGVPGEVTAAELVLKAVSIHLARRVRHERVKMPCTRSQLRGPIPATRGCTMSTANKARLIKSTLTIAVPRDARPAHNDNYARAHRFVQRTWGHLDAQSNRRPVLADQTADGLAFPCRALRTRKLDTHGPASRTGSPYSAREQQRHRLRAGSIRLWPITDLRQRPRTTAVPGVRIEGRRDVHPQPTPTGLDAMTLYQTCGCYLRR
jgi:hypothetical protein